MVKTIDIHSRQLKSSEPARRRKFMVLSTTIIVFIQLVILLLAAIFSPDLFSGVWPILLTFVILTLTLGLIAILGIPKKSPQVLEPASILAKPESIPSEKSVRDPLTNLFSRHYLEETLGRELQRSLRSHSTLGIIMLEIDQFEQIAKAFGRAASEIVLIKLADNLQEIVRVSDITCRLQDDQFVLIITEATRDLTLERAEHIRAGAESIRLNYDNQEISGIAISSGVAVYPEHGVTMDALLKNAKEAMDIAKNQGGNQVVVYQKTKE